MAILGQQRATSQTILDYAKIHMAVANCTICTRRLAGRQRKYCSRKCKNADTNHRHQGYMAQQSRGLQRKLALLEKTGARCSACGYDRNSAALTWHHVDPKDKGFELDMRSLSNRSVRAIESEVAKCILLCANCHAEMHYPQFATPAKLASGKK